MRISEKMAELLKQRYGFTDEDVENLKETTDDEIDMQVSTAYEGELQHGLDWWKSSSEHTKARVIEAINNDEPLHPELTPLCKRLSMLAMLLLADKADE